MILCIANILDADGIASVREAMAGGTFVDGLMTAGWASRLVKKNEQLAAGPGAQAAQKRVIDALAANAVFSTAVMPQRIGPPLFARYTPGMSFGAHVDNAVMGADHLRTDVSVTVFLAEPDDLRRRRTGDRHGKRRGIAYKLPAGSAVIYPSTTLHRVAEVTRGTREVAVTWAQSLVRSAERRELLFDLERARRALFERDGKTAEFDLLHKIASNLRRMWVEP